MKISVIGSGYVGLVTGACLADVGNHVICLDVDKQKIAMLSEGRIPIFEPGLKELVDVNVRAGRLSFTNDVEKSAKHGRVQFIAVGTPPTEDGSADLKHVLSAAESLAEFMDDSRVIVNKSTVPVGTAAKVKEAVQNVLFTRGSDLGFTVVSNPEFLKEGAAIQDFMRPDRIIVGADDPGSVNVMRQIYAPFERNRSKLLLMDIKSAELTKYAANAMLATRISFMNEMALLAEKIGADIDHVRLGIGSDPRIGSQFLYAGCGYGGSCFPKDVNALIRTAASSGLTMEVVNAAERANARQKQVLSQRVLERFGSDLSARRFAIWGLAFKPDTDDMREAPSITVISELLKRGAKVCAYDPIAGGEAKRLFGRREGLEFVSSSSDAVVNADALIIVTEWKEFRSPPLDEIKRSMKYPVIFDGRNILDPALARDLGFEYHGIGRL
jgi:UDPglucose 6-dehydrogenase